MRKRTLIMAVFVFCVVGACKSVGIDSSNLSSSDAIIGSSVSLFEHLEALGLGLQEGAVVCEYSEIGFSPIILNMYKDPENRDSSSHVLYIQENNDLAKTKKIYQDFKYNVGKAFEFGLYYVKDSNPRDNSQALSLESDNQGNDQIEESSELVETPLDPEAGKERTKVGEVILVNNGGDLMCNVVKLCSQEYLGVCSIQVNKQGGVDQITVK